VSDCVLRAEATGGVRQDRQFFQVEEIEDALALLVEQAFAADGHRGHLTTARGETVTHEFVAGVFSGARDEPGPEREITNLEWLVRG
jgi:hypothetical protein